LRNISLLFFAGMIQNQGTSHQFEFGALKKANQLSEVRSQKIVDINIKDGVEFQHR